MESSGMIDGWLTQYQSAFFNVYVPVPGKAQVENAVKQTHERFNDTLHIYDECLQIP